MARTTQQTFTLSEISNDTGISMPTLLKYKQEYTGPGGALARHVIGEGRTMRFKESSKRIFEKLRAQGISNRGRRAN